MKIEGTYPVSPDIEEQKRLIEGLTDQIVVEFEEVLLIQKQETADQCAWADIDFEFVIDSSGSRIKIYMVLDKYE